MINWKKKLDKDTKKYFDDQLLRPKESTTEAFNLFKKLKINNLKTLDLACGNGANLIYLKKKFNNTKYCLGLDFDKNLLKKASAHNHSKNLKFKYGNILKLDKKYKNNFELITSFQTLSWMEDYKAPSLEIIKMNSDYIFISSLFYALLS